MLSTTSQLAGTATETVTYSYDGFTAVSATAPGNYGRGRLSG
jgi:hypothetical protein